jgi:acyl-CoA synthetase (AMP-forming)/AMP-acid ligase II
MEPGEVEAVVESVENVNGCVVKLIKPVQVNNGAALQSLITHCIENFSSSCICDVQDQPQHDFLCAYVCLSAAEYSSSEQASTPGTLKLLPSAISKKLEGICAASLPKFMVPKFFVSCPVWPRTLSGKISRLDIPAISESLLHDLVFQRNK